MNSVSLDEHEELSLFLSAQASGVLAVPIDNTGILHAAAILYWHNPAPLRFYFVTALGSEKLALLTDSNYLPAAFVVGTEKGTTFTVQLRGKVHEINPEANKKITDNYYLKRANRNDDIKDPSNCLLEFIPDWARFIDYSKGQEKHMLDLRNS